MSIFSYIRSIYALDTIDTRFTSSSTTPYQAVVDARIDSAAAASKRDDSIPGVGVKTDYSGRPIAQPSKWKTPEFYFYYFIFIITVPYMFWVAYDVSRREYRETVLPIQWLTPTKLQTKITINTNTYFLRVGYQGAKSSVKNTWQTTRHR
jgi:hypothetical protein